MCCVVKYFLAACRTDTYCDARRYGKRNNNNNHVTDVPVAQASVTITVEDEREQKTRETQFDYSCPSAERCNSLGINESSLPDRRMRGE